MKTKVTLIIYSLAKGGAERIFTTIANHLDKDKFDVTVVTFYSAKDSYHINAEGVKEICFNESRSLKAIPKLFKFLLFHKTDYILTTIAQVNVLVGLMIPIIKLLSIGRKKTKYFLRESAIPSINNEYSKYPSWLLKFMIQVTYRNFDKIIAQGENMKLDLQNAMGLKNIDIQVINNPVQTFTIEKDKRKNSLTTFITVGNLRKEKGYDRIIKALSYLKDFPFVYKIAGDGPELNNIKMLTGQLELEDKVIFLGSISNVENELINADLFLQGSYYEGFPNALIEANSLGIPVIAFNVPGGTSEIVDNYQNGILVDDGNVKLYEQTIRKALTYPFDNKKIMINTQNRFGLKVIMNHYESIFKL